MCRFERYTRASGRSGVVRRINFPMCISSARAYQSACHDQAYDDRNNDSLSHVEFFDLLPAHHPSPRPFLRASDPLRNPPIDSLHDAIVRALGRFGVRSLNGANGRRLRHSPRPDRRAKTASVSHTWGCCPASLSMAASAALISSSYVPAGSAFSAAGCTASGAVLDKRLIEGSSCNSSSDSSGRGANGQRHRMTSGSRCPSFGSIATAAGVNKKPVTPCWVTPIALRNAGGGIKSSSACAHDSLEVFDFLGWLLLSDSVELAEVLRRRTCRLPTSSAQNCWSAAAPAAHWSKNAVEQHDMIARAACSEYVCNNCACDWTARTSRTPRLRPSDAIF